MTTETIMEIFRDTGLGRALHQEGRAEGREAGREEGREEGRVELLADLLRERFGDHPNIPAVAHRLATGPKASSAVHAISTAANMNELLP